MNIDPKRYERLCEACQELRPDGLSWWPDSECGETDFHTPMWLMNGNGPFMHTETIIRDKIQEWLNKKYGMCVAWGTISDVWGLQDNFGQWHVRFGDDYTDACLGAAEWILVLPKWSTKP